MLIFNNIAFITNLGSLSASALTRRNNLITIRLQKSNLSSMCIHIFEFFLLMFWGFYLIAHTKNGGMHHRRLSVRLLALKSLMLEKEKFFLRTSIFCLFRKKSYFCKTSLKVTAMARPIKETPILTGKDAERFVERAERVEKMSKEVRATNHAKLMERVKEAKKLITFCW